MGIIANEEKFFVENLTQTAIEIPWGVEVVWAILTFKKPENIDFSAKNYHSMVDFDEFGMIDVCSPPMLRDYSLDDIKNRNFSEGFKKVPSHSQHVERFVALTSKAAECAVGYQNRHQYILNKMVACKKVPTSARKDDFVNLVKKKDLKNVKKKLCKSTDE